MSLHIENLRNLFFKLGFEDFDELLQSATHNEEMDKVYLNAKVRIDNQITVEKREFNFSFLVNETYEKEAYHIQHIKAQLVKTKEEELLPATEKLYKFSDNNYPTRYHMIEELFDMARLNKARLAQIIPKIPVTDLETKNDFIRKKRR